MCACVVILCIQTNHRTRGVSMIIYLISNTIIGFGWWKIYSWLYVADSMLSFTRFDLFNLNTRIIMWTRFWQFINNFEKNKWRRQMRFYSSGCCASILRNDEQINIQRPSRVSYNIVIITSYANDKRLFGWWFSIYVEKMYLIGTV